MKTNGKIQLYPLVRVSIILMIGMMVGYMLRSSLSAMHWLLAAGIVTMMTAVMRKVVIQSLLVFAIVFLVGASVMSHAWQSRKSISSHGPVHYEAVVVSSPVVRDRVVTCDLLILSSEAKVLVKASFIRDERSEQLQMGDGLEACSVWKEWNKSQSAQFDYALYMRSHGYQAQTFVSEWRWQEVNLQSLSWFTRARLVVGQWRESLIGRLKAHDFFYQDLAVVTAMSLGDKTMINKEIRESYSISGVSHVLALSGMHLGIIYLVLSMTVARWRRCRGLLRPVSEGVILLAIWMYVFLVGMSPSVVRSAVMITVFSLMSLLHRGKMSLNVLGFTAIVMLLSNPMNLFDVGFQMSFIAVASILLFSHRIFVCLPTVRHRLLRWLWGLLSVSLAAQIGVAPLTAYYFGQVSCYFLFTNIIIVMLTTLIIYLSLAFFIFSWLTPVASLLAQLLSVVAHVQNTVVQWISTCPGSVIRNLHLHVVQVLLIYVIILCVYAMICRLDLYKHEKMITFAP